MRADPARLAAQPRHRAAIDEIVARGHLGDHKSGAERRSQTSERRIGDPRHRRQEDPVGDG